MLKIFQKVFIGLDNPQAFIDYFNTSKKKISSHGLEARTPFLDKNFVQSYLSIPAQYRFQIMKEIQSKKK